MTACRTIYVGDSGEFSLVFKVLGIAHPPGYPLFTLLGHTFIDLTAFLKPAFSANLLSVLIGSSTVMIVFFALGGKRQPVIAAILSLIWAFAASFWSETVGIEVYGLNVFLIALLYGISFIELPRKWYIASYLSGLAAAHHPSVMAICPALIYLYLSERKIHRWKPTWGMLGLFITGVSVYLYLPVRAFQSPIANWGHPVNLQLLWNHITGAQYQQAAEFSLSNFWSSLKLFFNLLLQNWWWLGIPAILAGIWTGLRKYAKKSIFLLILLAANILMVSFYRIPDIEPYYLPALFICFIFIAEWLIHIWKIQKNPLYSQGLIIGCAVVVLWMLAGNFHHLDRSDYTLSEDYGKLILDNADEGIVFTTNDNCSFPTLYLRYAEGYKPEITVYDKAVRLKPLVDDVYSKTGKMLGDYTAARDALLSVTKEEVYFVKSFFPFDTGVVDIIKNYYSDGILFSSVEPKQKPKIPEFKVDTSVNDFKSRQILINAALCRAQDAIQPGKTNQFKAIQEFEKAIDYMGNEPRASIINQLGVSFRHLKQRELALQVYEKALQAPIITDREAVEIRFNISNIYKDRGNDLAKINEFEGAAQAYLTALEFDPNNPSLLYNIGIIYVNVLQQPQRGIPYLEAYLKLNPTDQNVRNLLNSVNQ